MELILVCIARAIKNPQRPKSWGDKNYFKWDSINLKGVIGVCERILRKNGKGTRFYPRKNKMETLCLPSYF